MFLRYILILIRQLFMNVESDSKYQMNIDEEIKAVIDQLQLMGFEESRIKEAIESKEVLDIDTLVEELLQ